jgi:hypothetical protein
MRVACYVDGFNLYHAIVDLNRPYLKWVNLSALAQSLCRAGETLAKVEYFSAYATWKPDQYSRHRQYVAALKNFGVVCNMARFSEKSAGCLSCGAKWKRHEEKETDVHFSLTLLEDAIDDVFDRAIIISADSDHVPAVVASAHVFRATDFHSNATGASQSCSRIIEGLTIGHEYYGGTDSSMLTARNCSA